ncbi:hypothetical protein GGI25_005806 [Coemansia spiralis]|uniref:Uncharacterized protein n=2 Tax=Coemansia TaxID=4863 RepID=A0A9W8G1Z6_9FUNG|nr:hypothetical protein EDC05_005919 [Coemansia umbellata]KAJ2619208.1 hypothetical protein GGI26_006027 [Coemansia sp. RSA 1358]KAJ2670561.1 hypothetical protein GGI25_005806 [Coemansia spiralis]
MVSPVDSTAQSPRASLVALGLLAGVAALWVYAATRQTIPDQSRTGTSDGRTPLRRTRTIRRQRRRSLPINTNDVSPVTESPTRRASRASLSAVGAFLEEEEDEEATVAVAAAMAAAASVAADYADDDEKSLNDDESENGVDNHTMQVDTQFVSLVVATAEAQARRSSLLHRGVTCDKCNESPIRGVRYKCAQCPDIDLCESCEAHGAHQRHLMFKISVPLPPLMNNKIPIVHQFYPGNMKIRDISEDECKYLLNTTQLTRKEINHLYSQFCVLASANDNGDMVITQRMFYNCLGRYGSARSVMADRLFVYYDADKDNELTFREMAHGFSVYNKGTLEDKAPYVFRAYDVDGDGRISRDDMRVILEAVTDTSRQKASEIARSASLELLRANPLTLMPDQPLAGLFAEAIPDEVSAGPRKEVSSLRSDITSARGSTEAASAPRRVTTLPIRTQEPSETGDTASDVERSASETGSSATSIAATTSATIGTVTSTRMPRRRQLSLAGLENHQQPQLALESAASAGLEPVGEVGPLVSASQESSDINVSFTSATANKTGVSKAAAPSWPNAQIQEQPATTANRQTNNSHSLLPSTMWHDATIDQEWTVIEALNQDAVRIMMEEIFSEANPKDPFFMTYDEFLAYIRRNCSLVSYLETLGTIF